MRRTALNQDKKKYVDMMICGKRGFFESTDTEQMFFLYNTTVQWNSARG